MHRKFGQRDLSYEEWKSVLHLSTRWDFASIRRLALNNIQPPTSHDRLLLARTYSVNDWLVPALSELCEKRVPLSLDEARQMDIEDVVLVATIREDIRNHGPQAAAETPLRGVEAAQAGRLVPPTIPTNGAVGHPSSLTGERRALNGSESDGEAMVSSVAVDNDYWCGCMELTRVLRKRKRRKRILMCGQGVWHTRWRTRTARRK